MIFQTALQANAGRIRLRKVKDAPKVCSLMDEDKSLSRPDRRIFGTLKTSLIFEENIAVVNDLGKKVCVWSYDKWLSLGDLSKYKYFIDEQKEKLIVYSKIDGAYTYSTANLNSCDLSDVQNSDTLDLPKCVNKSTKKSKSSKRRKITQR